MQLRTLCNDAHMVTCWLEGVFNNTFADCKCKLQCNALLACYPWCKEPALSIGSLDVITRVRSALIKSTVRTSRDVGADLCSGHRPLLNTLVTRITESRQQSSWFRCCGLPPPVPRAGPAICDAHPSGAHKLPLVCKRRRTKVLNSNVSTLCAVSARARSARLINFTYSISVCLPTRRSTSTGRRTS